MIVLPTLVGQTVPILVTDKDATVGITLTETELVLKCVKGSESYSTGSGTNFGCGQLLENFVSDSRPSFLTGKTFREIRFALASGVSEWA